MVIARRFSGCLFFLSLFAALFARASAPSLVAAQTTRTRAIVLSFEGWHAEQARSAAVDGLSAAYDLITEQTAIDTAGQMGVDPATPEGMGAVVAQLHIELVVGGTVAGTGRTAETTVWVTDTQGNQLATRTVRGPGTGRRGGTEIGNSALEACAEAVMSLHPVGPGPEPQPIGPGPEPEAQPEPQPEPEPDHDPSYDIENEVAGESRGQRQDRERRARTTSSSGSSGPSISGRWNQPIFRGLIGVDVRNRVASVSPNPETNRFDSDFAPAIQLMLETRPFAQSDDALRGLYAYVWTEFSVGLSYFPDVNTDDTASMTLYGFDVGVGYAGTLAEIFELIGTIGFGMDGVGLSELDPPTPHFPSVQIMYVRPAIQARVRLVEDLLILEGQFGGRIMVNGGDLNTFGAPSGGGIDWSLGFAGIIDPGFTWQLRFGYSGNYITYSDDGSGLPFMDSGVEEAWRILIGIGWAFR